MYAPHLGSPGERAGTVSHSVVYYVVPALAGLTLVITLIVIVAYIRRRRHKIDREPRILE